VIVRVIVRVTFYLVRVLYGHSRLIIDTLLFTLIIKVRRVIVIVQTSKTLY